MSNMSDDFSRKYTIITTKDNTDGETFFKPNCPSRSPKPENVLFFNSEHEALDQGYRPCKRCKPLQKVLNGQSELIVSICRILEESESEPTLIKLAEKTGYSEGHLQKVFKNHTGISPKQYATALRDQRFRGELEAQSSITSKIYEAGFGSMSRVYENLDRILAMSPTQFQKLGKGIEMRMRVFSSYLGKVLIAFTKKGVAAVDLGDGEVDLKISFHKRFENAQISELNSDDHIWVESILKKIENPLLKLEIPMDIHGTIFQKKVWAALTNIPLGETRTYSEIASEIGQVSSVRAVANACGKNNIAVLIPCHRVVRKNGELAGYCWGKEKKQLLLEKEILNN